MQLSGHTILITGGASGIGLELARRLLAMNNTVIASGRDKNKLDAAKKALPGLHTLVNDISKPNDIVALHAAVTKDFPRLNILINNAGIMRRINLHHEVSNLTDLTQEIATNLSGTIQMTSQFLPHLKQQPTAAIMIVTSGLAFVPLPISPIYCATKAGLHSFSLSLRAQLKHTKVKVFELAPPATDTTLLVGANINDLKGIQIMSVSDMVDVAIKGVEQDRFEICPGMSKQLRLMGRIAPEFIFKQMSRTVERMLKSDPA
jgi:uncharacterized oxidoreductase